MSKPPQAQAAGSVDISESQKSPVGAGLTEAGNMDKIRDILFGSQARDYEKRFSHVEQQLNREAAELKEELLKRIDALEAYVKQEIKDLNQRIKAESSARADSKEKLQREMKDSFESLGKKILQEQENLAEKSTQLRELILEQYKQLTAEILSKHEQASSHLKQIAQELDDTKVNRSDLSSFFLEIAMRLSGEENMGSIANSNG